MSNIKLGADKFYSLHKSLNFVTF